MTAKQDFLVEIGTEELPPKALLKLSQAFSQGITAGLEAAGLGFGQVHPYAAPRRLAVLVKQLDTAQADKQVERRGPALNAAFDGEGKPSKATEGFARSCGVAVSELQTLETNKGSWLVYQSLQTGKPSAELLPAIVQQSLDKLPIPKRMRWGALEAEFVRPVHWLVMLLGDDVIDCEILSVKSGRDSYGHRFHHPDPIFIPEPSAYSTLLHDTGKVVADFTQRRELIREAVIQAAAAHAGTAVIDEDLLNEVTGLVEWPQAVVGSFEQRFLAVPPECLISAMKGHQKYFHMVDAQRKLMPNFITLSNISSSNPESVRAGNERVIRPRLTDADFFWTQDRKSRLEARRDSLATVLFQQKLGSLQDKSQRVAAVAEAIAKAIGTQPEQAARAALLAKCDLMTLMVGEFPELQGIMGRYYAEHDGEPAEVALALDEQYMPRFAGDQLPASKTGQAVAIADKLDTLIGIFGVGQVPSGDKDPFALRRAALGALRIIIEQGLDIDLLEMLEHAAEANTGLFDNNHVITQVFEFMMGRLKAYYQDRGVAVDTFEAVLAQRPTRPLDFDARLRAVSAFRDLPEAEALAAANKRIANILKKTEESIPVQVDANLLQDAAERQLYEQVARSSDAVTPLFLARDYTSALKTLAGLRNVVDSFFDQVMVMADEPALRANRLALLSQLRSLFLEVADLSLLQG
ncbi:MAG: glycine--tRNA ligase subunit beta [Chromatiales bacterium]|nr:glycine--tRNA ligase subunit beta [Gammaproteobacteria bacterium]MBW6475938.1 glycine--tRNA ligase subunit beta [Chromatiales bacterium]